MADRKFCATCVRVRSVVDDFIEEDLQPEGRFGFRVQELSCGHYAEGTHLRIGEAPGAPHGAPTQITPLSTGHHMEGDDD